MSSGHTTTLHWQQRLLIVAISLAMIASQTVGLAFASHGPGPIPSGGFEIDGNRAEDGNHDWAGVAHAVMEDATSDDKSDADDDIFAPGTKEHHPVWDTEIGSSHNKGDIGEILTAAQVAGSGSSFLWMAASTAVAQGNNAQSFEFNQTAATVGSTTITPNRTNGDLRITFSFPGNVGAITGIDVDYWSGSTWADAAVGTARGATGAGAERTFAEIEIDLTKLLETPGLSCARFGEVHSRTRASSSADSSLKDRAGPYAIDLTTCGGITVEKRDTDGNRLAGATYELYAPDGSYVGDCTTGTSGRCGWTDLDPTTGAGLYTITETIAPSGYALADPASQTTPLAFLTNETVVFVNPRVPYAIDVTPDDETNPVGAPHTFTVTLTTGAPGESPTDGDLSTPVSGATVDLAWSGPGSVDPTCTTDANGQCSIVLDPDTTGAGTLTATYTTPYQHVSSTGGSWTDSDATISDSGDKTWLGWLVDVSPDTATNLVDEDHRFTISVVEDDGEDTAAAGVKVTATWSGDANERTCTTDGTGVCHITITGPSAPTAGTLTVISVEGKLSSNANVMGKQSSFGPTSDVDGEKEWWDLEVVVTGDGVNPLGHDHDFTATATYLTPAGSQPANGISLSATWTTTTDSTLTSDNPCTTDASGQCTFTVSGATAVGSGTLTVTKAAGLATDPSATSTFAPSSDLTGDKGWADYRLRLTPGSARNDISDPVHTFTATVEAANGGGKWKPIEDVDVTATWDPGTAVGSSLTSPSTCTTDKDGQCTFTVTSPEGGEGTLTATATIAGPTTNDPDVDVRDTATKEWVQHRILVSDDAHNWVGDPHLFYLQVQRSFDDGATWVPEHTIDIDTTWTGTGWIHDATECDGDPTSGPCRIEVRSDEPGIGTLTIDQLQVRVGGVWVTLTGTDLVIVQEETDPDPEITKTWHEFRVLRDADAFNPVGEDHTFTLGVEYAGADRTWGDAPDGTLLDLEWSGVGSIVESQSTCLTTGTVDGECTVVVTGEGQTGTGTLAVIAVDNPIKDLIPDLHFDITGVTMSKTWGDRFITIEPATARTQVGQTHTYIATLFDRTIEGTGPDAEVTDTPLPFERLDLSLDGPGHMTRVVGADLFQEGSAFQLSALLEGPVFDDNGGWISDEDDQLGACITAGSDHATLRVGQCLIDTQSPETGTDTMTASHQFGGTTLRANTLLAFSNHTPFTISATATNVWFRPSSPPPPPPPPPSTPAVDLVKTGSTTTAEVGDTVAYTYEITNTGSTSLDVVLSDVITIGGATVTVDLITAADGVTLAAGASTTRTFSYQVTASDLPGPILNVATVTGTAPDGVTVTASDDWSVDLIEVLGEVITRPSIEVVKEALVPVDPDSGAKVVTYEEGTGDVIEYRYTVTNTGDVTLTDLTVIDDVLGEIFPATTTLAPGESTTATATHVLTQADAILGNVVNVVIVTATDPDGEDVSDTDTETVEVIEVLPSIEERPPTPAPLPRTGANANALFTWSLLLTAMGAALVFGPETLGAARRRREDGAAH